MRKSHWLVLTACLGVACAEEERPPLVSPRPGGNGGTSARGGGSTDGGEAGTDLGGTGGTGAIGGSIIGGGNSGTGGLGNPDPGEVTIYGSRNAEPALPALCHWEEPETYAVGFSNPAFEQIGESGLFYLDRDSDVIRRFVPDLVTSELPEDVPYPSTPSANDPIVPTPACEGDLPVNAFVVGPGDRIVYHCLNTFAWWDGTTLVYSGTGSIIALGYDDIALIEDLLLFVVELGTGRTERVDGLSVFDVRAVDNVGFHVVSSSLDGVGELVELRSDGTTTVLGTYPELPSDLRSVGLEDQVAIDANDVLFQIAQDFSALGATVVLRQPLDEPAEVVYSTADDPPVLVQKLLSGP